VFIEAKDDGSGGGNWRYKSRKAPVKLSPPTNQHLAFYRLDALQCQSTEGKISHSMDLLTPSSSGVFQLCLWPLIASGYLGGGFVIGRNVRNVTVCWLVGGASRRAFIGCYCRAATK